MMAMIGTKHLTKEKRSKYENEMQTWKTPKKKEQTLFSFYDLGLLDTEILLSQVELWRRDHAGW